MPFQLINTQTPTNYKNYALSPIEPTAQVKDSISINNNIPHKPLKFHLQQSSEITEPIDLEALIQN